MKSATENKRLRELVSKLTHRVLIEARLEKNENTELELTAVDITDACMIMNKYVAAMLTSQTKPYDNTRSSCPSHLSN